MNFPKLIVAIAITLLLAASAVAQNDGQQAAPFRAHDRARPLPQMVTPVCICQPVTAPSDAIVLFDGSHLNHWQSGDGEPAKWIITNGAMESVPGGGYLKTRDSFGDVQLHVEWATPNEISGGGQGRGNSGVYLMGEYEVQVLDSYHNTTYADGQAGAIYGQNPPLVNASLPPGQWQTYDIIFRRPRFSDNGELTQPARLTVLHNGILIQDAFKVWGPTNWLRNNEYTKHAEALPISLQDHGNPVRFRNIWVRRLPDPAHYDLPAAAAANEDWSKAQMQELAGRYEREDGSAYLIRHQAGTLQLKLQDRDFDLVPQSDYRLEFKHTDAAVEVVKTNGQPSSIVVDLMGDRREAKRVEQ